MAAADRASGSLVGQWQAVVEETKSITELI